MDLNQLIEQIIEAVENDKLEKAVLKSYRLARAIGDYSSATLFLMEAYGSSRFFSDQFASLTHVLPAEERASLMNHAKETFWNERQLPKDKDDQPKLLVLGAGELDTDSERLRRLILSDIPAMGLASYDAASLGEQARQRREIMENQLLLVNKIRGRVKARCHTYATSVEAQLAAQRGSELFLHEVQNSVNAYFRDKADAVYQKLIKALTLVASDDPEDQSLLLTEVRRAIKAVADHFFPSQPDPVMDVTGKLRDVGDEQYMNRIEQYVRARFKDSSSRELLAAEAQALAQLMRKLNQKASKGVHVEVTNAEAKQGLVALYFFLSHLISLLQHVEPDVNAQESVPPQGR